MSRTSRDPIDRFPLRAYLSAAALLGLAVALLLWAAHLRGMPVVRMLDDPASFYEYSPLSGLVSYGGILLMTATAAICAFAASVGVRRRGVLAGVALFSGYFAVDDLLMLHEAVWPRLGIPEEAVLLGFALALLAILWGVRPHSSPDRPRGLYVALAFMALSILIDMGFDRDATSDALNMVEDVLKFISLGVWTMFWTGVASGAVAPRAPAPCDPDSHPH